MNNELAASINKRAIELDYDSCGIISTEAMRGYADALSRRIDRFPNTKTHSERFFNFAFLDQNYPWAKSVVVCVRHYGKYRIPQHLQGVIAKYYLVDGRIDKNSEGYQASVLFEDYLQKQGLKTATNRKFGVTALRWAAQQAGLGVVRKNNFFYTEKGSWVHLEAWLIDAEAELKASPGLKPCPGNCHLCIDACPTKALSEPFAMNRDSCVSCITCWDGRDMPNEKHREQLGDWVFGCDACQDACPYNKGKWSEDKEFPGLDDLGERLSLEKIVLMDYDTLRNVIAPKFFYIGRDDVWKWKVNAINAMINSGIEKYRNSIETACNDDNEKVREMARFALIESA